MGKQVMRNAVLSLELTVQSCQLMKDSVIRWSRYYSLLLFVVFCLCGCATSRPVDASAQRPFDFQKDTFAYANDLVWEYHFDERGKWVSQPRQPKPDYTHH
ncbi:MAG: hypothetical protein JWQ71_1439, partial [Pedosphaera sp.]|nr:hypothetical protein [Pedosphaera sp.]